MEELIIGLQNAGNKQKSPFNRLINLLENDGIILSMHKMAITLGKDSHKQTIYFSKTSLCELANRAISDAWNTDLNQARAMIKSIKLKYPIEGKLRFLANIFTMDDKCHDYMMLLLLQHLQQLGLTCTFHISSESYPFIYFCENLSNDWMINSGIATDLNAKTLSDTCALSTLIDSLWYDITVAEIQHIYKHYYQANLVGIDFIKDSKGCEYIIASHNVTADNFSRCTGFQAEKDIKDILATYNTAFQQEVIAVKELETLLSCNDVKMLPKCSVASNKEIGVISKTQQYSPEGNFNKISYDGFLLQLDAEPKKGNEQPKALNDLISRLYQLEYCYQTSGKADLAAATFLTDVKEHLNDDHCLLYLLKLVNNPIGLKRLTILNHGWFDNNLRRQLHNTVYGKCWEDTKWVEKQLDAIDWKDEMAKKCINKQKQFHQTLALSKDRTAQNQSLQDDSTNKISETKSSVTTKMDLPSRRSWIHRADGRTFTDDQIETIKSLQEDVATQLKQSDADDIKKLKNSGLLTLLSMHPTNYITLFSRTHQQEITQQPYSFGSCS